MCGARARFEDNPVFGCRDSTMRTRPHFGVSPQDLAGSSSQRCVTDLVKVHLFGTINLLGLISIIVLHGRTGRIVFYCGIDLTLFEKISSKVRVGTIVPIDLLNFCNLFRSFYSTTWTFFFSFFADIVLAYILLVVLLTLRASS